MNYKGEQLTNKANWKFYDNRPVFSWRKDDHKLCVDVEMIDASSSPPADMNASAQAGIAGSAIFLGGGGGMYIG